MQRRFDLPPASHYARLAGAVALGACVIALAGPARAQNQPVQPPPAAQQAQPPAPSAEAARDEREAMRAAQEAADRKAFFEARLAAIHAGLQLTPEQEKLWPQAEAAARNFAEAMRRGKNAMRERRMEMRDDDRSDPLAMMRARAEMALARGQAMKAFVDGVSPLHDSLTADQKARLRALDSHGIMMAMRSGMKQRMMDMREMPDGYGGGDCGPMMEHMMDHMGRGGMMGGGMMGGKTMHDHDADRDGYGWRGYGYRDHGRGEARGLRYRDEDRPGMRGRDWSPRGGYDRDWDDDER